MEVDAVKLPGWAGDPLPGVAIPEPAKLVQPLTFLVTEYVPDVFTVIEAVFAPLLHNIVPPVGIDKVELPQLFTTVTTGVAGIAFTVIVTTFDVAGLPVTFGRLEVITT